MELSSGTARKMRLVSSFSIRDCSGPRACVKTWCRARVWLRVRVRA